MKLKKQLIKLTVCFLSLLLLLAACILFVTGHSGALPAVRGGALDISRWNPDAEGVVPLNGSWNFYWKRFIPASRLEAGLSKPDLSAKVPEVWTNYRIGGKNLSGFGYATYSLKVTGAVKGRALSLWLPTSSTAYRLFINGRQIAQSGNPTAGSVGFKPRYNPQAVAFTPENGSFYIVVQVSNYTYARGGMWFTPYLGTVPQIASLERGITYRDLFLLGAFFMMAFTCLAIFLLRRRERANIYLILLSVIAAGRTLVNGAYSVYAFLPFLGFDETVRIDYLTLFWFPTVYILLLRKVFSQSISKKACAAAVCYSALMSLVMFVTPVRIFTNLNIVLQAAVLVGGVYMLSRLVSAYLRGVSNAGIVLAGTVLLILCGVYDALFQDCVISGGVFELSPVGVFILLLINSFVLARRFADALSRSEAAVREISLAAERERRAELKFLQSQIKPHFIHNCLNTIIALSRTDMEGTRKLLLEFSRYLRSSFDFHDLEDTVPIENELQLVRSYVILEQARFGDKLHVDYDTDETGLMIPPLILQPLVENAIAHGLRPKNTGGNILVFIKNEGSFIRLGVEDDGVGIGEEKLGTLLSGAGAGRGVGIFNINKRLNRLFDTSLHIENLAAGGVRVYAELPLNGGENDDQSNTG